ncbi:MAG: thioredoxin family protein [Sandaracinaceae bacterium]|nr:thioredoxin family protein [Sandaracinaceae bacterium]
MRRLGVLAACALALGCETQEIVHAQAGVQAGPPPEVARPYQEGADAQAQIDAAVARARRDGKRVLVVFGANWCSWCRRLEHVLQNDPGVSGELARSYHVVHVDVGPRRSDTNRAVVQRYGNPMQHGLPCLVILDTQGSLLHVQETGSLEIGDRHDPARVLGVLTRWRG